MAKLGRPMPWPKWNLETWREDEQKAWAAIDQTRVVKWQRADGYAMYYIESMSPLVLRHIPQGDGYTVEAALIRGLRRTDVQQMLDREAHFRELFSRGKGQVKK